MTNYQKLCIAGILTGAILVPLQIYCMWKNVDSFYTSYLSGVTTGYFWMTILAMIFKDR